MSSPSLAIYNAKRKHGQSAVLYQRNQYSVNYNTGVASSQVQTLCVSVIPIPELTSLQSLVSTLISSQLKPDQVLKSAKTFLIDTNELPNGWEVSPKDWIVLSNKRYEISSLQFIDELSVIIAKAVEIPNETIQQIHSLNIVDYVSVSALIQ